MGIFRCPRCGGFFHSFSDEASMVRCPAPDCSFTDGIASFLGSKDAPGSFSVAVDPLLEEIVTRLASGPEKMVESVDSVARRFNVSADLVAAVANSLLHGDAKLLALPEETRFVELSAGEVSLEEVLHLIRNTVEDNHSKSACTEVDSTDARYKEKYFELQEIVSSLQTDKDRLLEKCRQLKEELRRYREIYG